ncbi:AAA family ATPase [Polymorphum gilvum]|uniref:Chromosome partition protein Smc n=1 Tax=Polymorphum gilvum (strain LMG 25793 / CGMCC 1.9160 / SL003B-26A1) TaxID=991905 RepID=F2IZ62_POLGS|nr:AAA family ATPase [Polymorphum gilvum]ADZ71785.1 RecF/RecN/SMC N terminal domain, putative [Polymorphum gilvum SL003B-26A1]
MKFNKLRVVGFKSFVEPMEFIIGDGLTGVVGPNGCGKSNLVEALRWVMGENSYKNMRASGMDDVIFSGSLNRPARNTAEVTLYLDNSERRAPSGFNETDLLEVSRRIEREAGSIYRINAKEVRARDVQLLFADASTGARSPAMVRQGQIGELISAKPTSRRQILEEAAGISGLHSRRHEAEIRLRAAEQNLDRLEDVLVQIDAQLDSLRRQSRQAARYRNLSAEIRSAEAAILYLRWTDARAALADAERQYEQAQKDVAAAAAAQAEAARTQAITAHKLPEIRDAAARAGALLQRLVIARNELDAEDRRIRERLLDLDRRLGQLAEDIAREDRMVAENDEVLERLAEERAELVEENETVAERAELARERVEDAQSKVDALEEALGERTRAQARAAALRQQMERAVAEARLRAERLTVQAGEAAAVHAALRAEMDAADGIAQRVESVELAEATLLEAEEAGEGAEEVTRSAREAEQAARVPLAEAERVLSSLETEARTLEQVLNVSSAGEWPPVVDAVTVAPGFETALGAALGEDLDASLDPGAPVRWGGTAEASGDPALPAGAVPMAAKVGAPPALARRLAQIGLVERAEGPRLQALLKPGQRLVSRDGDLWRWDGFVVAADAPTPAAQRLAQKNRLAELADRIEGARREVDLRQAGLQAAADAVRQAVEREQAARQRLRDRQKALADARDALAAAERALSQLSARLAAAEQQASHLAEEAGEACEALMEAEARLEEAPDAAGLGEDIARLQDEVAVARTALAEARALSEGLSRERQMRDRRLEAIAREYDSWRTRAANAARQIEILRQRRQEAEDERLELVEAPEDIEARRRSLFSEIARAEEARKAADDELLKAESALSGVDRIAREAQDALAQAREARIRAEERVEGARQRVKEVEARIGETLEVPLAELTVLAGLKDGAPLPDPDGMERKLERLKAERERLGGVNLRADDELRDIDEQRTTLVRERDDLVEAIRRLRTGISNLNREARERLLSSFVVVNDHFQRLFTHLFGGGTAELQLVDSDDPLDAGLEIIARPPGKKPQTMTLLSGGEQALTAMALIFAVFLTNPAPICVLDEVDAPLDDANVERYCDLLDEMARRTDTRFVVITHNPITMARMNRLFGVTMAERGVSQLVSVDLETAERFREAV